MNGSFACPECGGMVELRGLAPGRQVRCAFCQQLLEIPYLPRVPSSRNPRRSRPKWVAWSWLAIGVSLAVVLTWGSLQFWRKHERSRREAGIQRLIASSSSHEQAGHLDEALVDLDAALELVRQAGTSQRTTWEAQRKRRQDLARRDAEKTLEGLDGQDPSSLPLGDWLNLIARSERDSDLAPLQARIAQRFRAMTGRHVDVELAAAERSYRAGKAAVALQSCDQIAKLLKHLDDQDHHAHRRATEGLVRRLLESHGVVVEPIRGEFVFGSESSLTARLVPIVVKGLEAKGYLPYRAESPWADLWKYALYRLQVQFSEHKEGHYPSTQSRLTLIRVHSTLTARGVKKWDHETGARARVPVPNLSAAMSAQMAAESESSDVLEQVLYKDALGQMSEKLTLALTKLPECAP